VTDRYLPVPVWNNRIGHWEPIDFRHGQRVAAWPDGLDLARLPLPDYRDGDRVQFVRDETCAREGVVRMVLLRGGTYRPWDQVEVLIEQWYCQPESLRYIVTARGHDHTIRPGTILGRFVSRNRWER
jgi:hypothetical protein